MKTPCKLNVLSRAAFALVLAWTLAPVLAPAQATPNPPGQISYQGFLVDANGIPLATNAPKNYDVAFRIYNQSTGNNPAIWGELQTVTVDRGYFSVLLGQGAALVTAEPFTNNLTGLFALPDASDRFIGITVKGLAGGDIEIQPRLRLLASPYALLAANANAVVGTTGQQVLTTLGSSVGIGKTPSTANALDVAGIINATALSGIGSNLTSLSAANISSGVLDDARLSPNVALLNGNQTFTGNNTFNAPSAMNSSLTLSDNLSMGGGFRPQINFGNQLGPKLILWNPTFGFGIQNNTMYARSGGNFAWFQNGTHSDGQLDPGSGGTSLMTLNGSGLGVGVGFPFAKLQVAGSGFFGSDAGGLGNGAGRGVRVFLDTPSDAGQVYAYDYANGLPKNLILNQPGASIGLLTGSISERGVSLGGLIHMNDFPIYLRGGADHNHWLSWVSTYDGPGVTGYQGGVLGTTLGGFQASLWWNYFGNVFVRGGLFQFCDRNAKENFSPVDSKAILAKVRDLPIEEWTYKSDASSRHVGPMAQDFYSAFGLGMDDKHIATVDEGGVALAAIKGLNEVVEEKDAEIKDLKREVQELRKMVEEIAKAKAVEKQ